MMRKTHIKKIAVLRLALLLSSLLLWNCQEELKHLEVEQHSETNFQRSIVSEHYLKFHKPDVYLNLKTSLYRTSGGLQKAYSEEYDFVYNLDRVQIIETAEFTQYSLLVVGPNTDSTHFENYVYMDYANGDELQLLFTFEKNATDEGYEINHSNTQVEVLGGNVIIPKCSGGYELVDVQVMSGCFEVPCTGNNLHMPNEDCPCGTSHECIPPQVVCSYDTVQQWRQCGGAATDPNPTNPNTGQTGGASTNTGANNSGDGRGDVPVVVLEEDVRLTLFVNSLDSAARAWWEDDNNRYIRSSIQIMLELENYSDESILWSLGQIELELLAGEHNWVPSEGTIAGFKYTHKHSLVGTLGTFFKLEDDSIVFSTGTEKTLSQSGDLVDKFRGHTELDPNEHYYYIKIPGQEWAEMLFDPNNLADQLATLFQLAGIELGKSIGRYVLPIEDIKILIDGRDFDGNEVSRLQAAGFLILGIIPGGKALRLVDDIADAVVVAVKLRGGTHVIDTAAAGLRMVHDAVGNVVVFLNNIGQEVARVVDGIMTIVYNGFGGNIVSTANKTTTIIGKWDNVIENFWNNGLAKQGENIGGFNILGTPPSGTIDEIWAFNKQWLDEALARGDVIRVSANPLNIDNIFHNLNGVDTSFFNSMSELKEYLLTLSPDLASQLGYFGKEVRHLFQNGYNFNSSLSQFTL